MRSTVLLCLLGLCAGPAWAASIVAQPVSYLTSASDLVVRADVGGARFEVDADGKVWTHTALTITECWRGDCPTQLDLTQLGGAYPDGRFMLVHGDLEVREGDDVVVFLRRAEGMWTSLLLGWSVFDVVGDQVHRNQADFGLHGRDGHGRLGPVKASEVAVPRTLAELKAEVSR